MTLLHEYTTIIQKGKPVNEFLYKELQALDKRNKTLADAITDLRISNDELKKRLDQYYENYKYLLNEHNEFKKQVIEYSISVKDKWGKNDPPNPLK